MLSWQAAGSVSVGWLHYQAGLRAVSGAVSAGGGVETSLGLNITPHHYTGQSTVHGAHTRAQGTVHSALT